MVVIINSHAVICWTDITQISRSNVHTKVMFSFTISNVITNNQFRDYYLINYQFLMLDTTLNYSECPRCHTI